MKKYISILLLCLMALNVCAQKQAILVVQFGTSNEDGRTKALDVVLK